MIISKEVAEKVKVKRAKKNMTKLALSKKLEIARQTLVKVENGDYDAPKKIYEKVMNWLVEDL